MKTRLYIAVLVAFVSLFSASFAQAGTDADANDGYSWFDGR